MFKEIIFSIIIPAFNSELYIERCLISVLNQNYNTDNFEIIIVNDGSTDNTPHILEYYKNKCSNIICINQINKGLGGARNTGIKNASGKYVLFLDSDDFLLYKNTLKILAEISMNSDYDFIYNTDINIVDSDSTFVNKFYNENIQYKSIDNHIFIESYNFSCAVWRYLIKKEFLQKYDLYFREGVYYEDTDFTAKLVYYAEKVKVIKFNYYCYCLSPNSIVRSFSDKTLIDNFEGLLALKLFIDAEVKNTDIYFIFNDRIKVSILSFIKMSIHYPLSINLKIVKSLKINKLLVLNNYKLNYQDYLKIFFYKNLTLVFLQVYKSLNVLKIQFLKLEKNLFKLRKKLHY